MNKIYSTLFSIGVLAASCVQGGDTAATFSPFDDLVLVVEVDESTRGELVASEQQMASIGLYCAYTKDSIWSSDTIFDKMFNTRLSYNAELSEWLYDEAAPTWDFEYIVDKYTFMAYSPYQGEGNGIEPNIVGGDLVISYRTPADYSNQSDLMMAIPRKDIYPLLSRVVYLNFRHALASVGFSVKGVASDIITEIAIKGVVDSGKVSISDSGEFEWTLGEVSQLSYSAGIDSDVEPDIYTPQGLTLDNGYLMMIPQDCSNIELEAVVYSSDSGEYRTIPISLNGVGAWEAGQVYNYTINISSYDYTIEGTSNCYMLHPDGAEQIFHIPVEGRINTFWRDYADDNQTYKDMLSSSDVWQAYVLWSDVDGNMDNFVVERVTSGFSPQEVVTPLGGSDFTTLGTRSAMKITLPADITEGNILVAVEFEGQILWSWHLWITEYNPDLIAAANVAQSGVYLYTASGVDGEVHRYDNEDLWLTLYDNRFIMDRNIGAVSSDYSSSRYGVMHYQFGRKDPFPATRSISTTIEDKRVSFMQAVNNPTTFYTRGSKPYSWSYEGLNMKDEYLWFDNKVLNSVNASGKSIFDPSPLGWRVPRFGTFTPLNKYNCKYISTEDILLYNNVVKFPMTGYRSNNSGAVNDYGEQGNLRLSTQLDESFGYNLVYNPDIDEDTNNTLSDGFCVRSIEE